MNEEAIKVAYNLFVQDGYKKDINSFKTLMQTNEDARGVAHELFVNDGYKKGIADFSILMGVDDVKKKDAAVQNTNATASSSAGTPSASSESIDAVPELNMNISGASMMERFGAKAPKGAGPANVAPPPTEQGLAAPRQQVQKEVAATQANIADRSFKENMQRLELADVSKKQEEAKKRFEEIASVNATPEFKQLVSSINPTSINKTEEQLVPELVKKFGRYGFTFEETGVGNNVIVRSANGEAEITIPVNSADKEAANQLSTFIKEHATDYKKNLNGIEKAGEDFYSQRGLDYMAERHTYDEYVKTRDKISAINSEVGKVEADPKVVAKYPELFVNGRLRSDYDGILNKLSQKKDVLFNEVYGREDVMKAREDFDLQLQKWSDSNAKEAAIANANLKQKNQELSDYVQQTFGVSLDQLNTIKPTTPEQQQALLNVKAKATEIQNLQNLSAIKYETAKTFFNEKVDKSIAKNFNENLSAVYNSLMDASNSQTAGKELIILKAKMISGQSDITDIEQAANIIAAANNASSNTQSRVMTRKEFAQGMSEGWEVFKKDPIEYVASVVSSSIGQLLPYGTEILASGSVSAAVGAGMAASAAAPTVVGTAPAALAGAATGFAGGITTGMTAASTAMEYTGALMDAMTKRGYDLRDPESVKKALQDQSVWSEGERIGVTRGLTIGAMDAITGHLAGNIVHTSALATKGTKILAQVAERGVIDPLAEGTGELAAQFVSGQKISMADVLDESIGSIGSNTPNMAVNLMAQSVNNQNQNLAASLTNTAYLSSLKESNSKVLAWADNMKKLGKIPESTHKAIANNVAARQITQDILGENTSDERMKVRVMDLVKAREELSSTPERQKIYSEEIGKINEEIKNTAKSNQILSAEQQVDLDALPLAKNKTQTNAVQEQATDESVLRTEQPEVGLQEVGQGNTEAEVATEEGTETKVEPAIAATETAEPLTEADRKDLADEISDFETFLDNEQKVQPDFKAEDHIPSLDENGDFVVTFGKFAGQKFSETPAKYQQWLRTESYYSQHLANLEQQWKAQRGITTEATPIAAPAPTATAPVQQAAPTNIEAVTQNGKQLKYSELNDIYWSLNNKTPNTNIELNPIEYNGNFKDVREKVDYINSKIEDLKKAAPVSVAPKVEAAPVTQAAPVQQNAPVQVTQDEMIKTKGQIIVNMVNKYIPYYEATNQLKRLKRDKASTKEIDAQKRIVYKAKTVLVDALKALKISDKSQLESAFGHMENEFYTPVSLAYQYNEPIQDVLYKKYIEKAQEGKRSSLSIMVDILTKNLNVEVKPTETKVEATPVATTNIEAAPVTQAAPKVEATPITQAAPKAEVTKVTDLKLEDLKDIAPNFYSYLKKIYGNTPPTLNFQMLTKFYSMLRRTLPNQKTNSVEVLKVMIDLDRIMPLVNDTKSATKQDVLNALNKSDFNEKQKEVLRSFIESLKSDVFPDVNIGSNLKDVFIWGKNFISLKRADSFMHEFGHWAFFNLLSPEDRIQFYQYAIDRFNDGKFKMSDELVQITGLKSDDNTKQISSNATDNFDEYWANQFDQYLLTGLADEKIKTILDKIKDYFVNLLNAYKSKGYNPELTKYFDKIIDREKFIALNKEPQATTETAKAEAKPTEPAKTEATPMAEAGKVEVSTPPKDKTQLLMRVFSRLRKYSEPKRMLETLQTSKGLNSDQAQVYRDQIREGKVALKNYLRDVVGYPKDKIDTIMNQMEKVMGMYSTPAEILKSYDAAREKKQETPLTKIIDKLMESVDKKVETEAKAKPETKTEKAKPSKPTKVVGFKGTRGTKTMSKFKSLFNGDFFRMMTNNNMNKVGQLAALMQKAFPDVVFSLTQEDFDNYIANEPNLRLIHNKNGRVIYGVAVGNKVYINPSAHFSESEIFDTMVHEFGHVWQTFLNSTEEGKRLYNLGTMLIQDAVLEDAYIAKTYEEQLEKFNGNEKQALREVMAILIGNKGADILNKKVSTDFKNWLFNVWSYIKKYFKMSSELTPEDISNMTLDQFLNTAMADLMSGEQLVKMTDEQLADFGYFGETKTSESIHSIIQKGRQNGFSDASIREVLKKRGFKSEDINQAMVVQVDILTPAMPEAFGNVEGGAIEGLKLFEDVREDLYKFANKANKEGKKPSMAEVRQKAMDLMNAHEIFQKQTPEQQMNLLVAMDNTLNTRANQQVQQQIDSLKLALRNRKIGAKAATDIKNKMRAIIKEKISLIDGVTRAEVNKLTSLVAKATEANMIASLEKLEEVLAKIDKRIDNQVVKETLRDVRNDLRLQKKGANDLRTLQTYMKNMLRATLPLGKYTRGDIKKVMAAIVNLNAEDFPKQMEKVSDFIKTKLKRAMLDTITEYGKKAKSKTNKAKSAGLDSQGQSFFNTAAKLLKASLKNDVNTINEMAQKLSNSQEVNEAVAAYVNNEELTSKQQNILDVMRAFSLFGNINNMEIPDLQDLAKSLEDERSASVARLSADREARAAMMESLKFEGEQQIKQEYPALFRPDGSIKSKQLLDKDQEDIWNAFKQLKIWEGIKRFAERIEFQQLNAFRSTFRNWISHIGALTEILDKGNINKFFEKNFYDRLNLSNTLHLKGIYDQEGVMDSIASAILGPDKKYKDLFKMIGDVKPVEYVHEGVTYALSGGKMARIYALSLNPTQRDILISNNGISEAKLAEIQDALGSQITGFVDSLVDYLSNDYFNSINKVYKKMFDVSLRFVANYFPTVSEQKTIDSDALLNGDFMKLLSADNASALKERSNTNNKIDLDIDFRAATEHYFASMERFKAYAENARIISNLLQDESVNTLLEQTGLKNVFTLLLSQAISPTPKNKISSKIADWVFTSFTGAALLFKPIQMLKQASSIVAAFSDYKYSDKKGLRSLDYLMWTLDVAKVMMNPKKYIKMMTQLSPDYKERLQSLKHGDLLALEAGLYHNAKKYDETLAHSIRSRIKEAGGLFMLAGDTVSTFGYIANYIRDIENGMPQEEALKKFANYNAALQTRRATEKVALQYEANVLVRSQTLFMTAFYANINKVATTQKRIIRSISKREMPSTRDLRTFFIHLGVANALSEVVSNMFLLGSDDDEDIKKAQQRIKDMMSGLGLLYQVPLLGAALELSVAKARGEQDAFTSGGVNPLVKLITSVSKGIKEDDLRQEIAPMVNFLMGISTDPFIGLYDYANGDDDMTAVYEMLGISKSYRPTEHTLTDEDLKMIDESLWEQKHPESEDKELKEMMGAPEKMMRQSKADAYGYSPDKKRHKKSKRLF